VQASLIETRTLAEQIAAHVRDDVLSGQLPAGRRLSQEALAAQYAVSRVPVRDALRMLHAEGLISTHPRFGTRVAPLSALDLEELYEMRLALEPLVSRLATPRMRSRDVEEMQRQLETMAASRHDSRGWFIAHAAFHRALNERSGRERICALVDNLRAQTERYVRAYQVLEWPATELQHEHELILAAVRQGDPEKVAAVVCEHLEIVRGRMLDYLRVRDAGEAAR
jgi:DNA-binding GntR family transcriptional regulator